MLRRITRFHETLLSIRIIPSICVDLTIPDQYLIALQQSAVKRPRINVQPDFVGVS
ncbi:Uncharacterised protein [uncultured archaeon]|nr:Uncharacterised protein [uncultured archaeon]